VSLRMNENKQLFAEQIGDHIEKLNDLMVNASGEIVGEDIVQRTCLATRLLEGSTNMLGFETWSRTLGMLRKLLEHSLREGMKWNEQLSQIVSEVLEAEEQVAVEINAGEGGENVVAAAFEGLRREIEALIGESIHEGRPDAFSLRFEPLSEDPATSPAADREGSAVLDTLIQSLLSARTALEACVKNRDRSDRTIEDLTRAIGESEFLFAIVRDIVSHVAADRCTFVSRVSGSTVLEGLRDFFDVHVRLRGWRAELEVQDDDMMLDGELARALMMILERCLFDTCSMYESREGFELRTRIQIINRGLFLEVRIFDNGPDFLSDTEAENYDAAAFYKGLISARAILKQWGGLLWVEPDMAEGERFRFTLPRSRSTDEYRILEISGLAVAVPSRSIECVIETDDDAITHHNGDRYVRCGGRRVPLYRIDELAGDQVEFRAVGDRIAVVGLAEERIGIFVSGDGTAVEGIADQLTENGWAELSSRQLHMGEREYPVLDMQLVLGRMDYLKQLDRVPETSGSLPMGEEVEDIDTESAVPRV
jgi:hypothetical protein